MLDSERAPALAAGLLIAAFLAQHLFIAVYGEPYPALLMPDFSGGGQMHGARQVFHSVRFDVEFADGSTKTLTARELLRDIPDSQHWAIVNNTFRRLDPGGTAADEPIRGWLPGRQRWWQRRYDRSRAFKAAPWLRARLERMFPGERPSAVTVRWIHIVVGNGTLERRPIETGRIPLE